MHSDKSPVDWGFYKCDDFLALPSDPNLWLIKPLIPKGGRVNLFGQPKKARKSYLALGMSEAIASGRDEWLGFEVKDHGPVLFFQADTPHAIWRQRIKDLKDGGYDFSNVYFASLITMPYPFNINEHEEILAEMVNEVPEKPVLMNYDTLRSLHQYDENSSQEMTMLMASLDKVAGIDQAKLYISHDKKGGNYDKGDDQRDEHEVEGGDLMRGNRGSGAVAGGVDTIIKMSPKGTMYYQGRAVGEEHKKLKWTHIHGEMGYMWLEDLSDDQVEARALIDKFKDGSERSLARLLARSRNINEEKARAIIRKQKEMGQ